MTNEELKEEFGRWLDNGKGEIWYKYAGDWELHSVTWDSSVAYYVTNNKHQELRRLQIDEPTTKFEVLLPSGTWGAVTSPVWCIHEKYRVEVTPVYEWQYTYKTTTSNAKYALTEHIEECNLQGYIKLERSKRIKNV